MNFSGRLLVASGPAKKRIILVIPVITALIFTSTLTAQNFNLPGLAPENLTQEKLDTIKKIQSGNLPQDKDASKEQEAASVINTKPAGASLQGKKADILSEADEQPSRIEAVYNARIGGKFKLYQFGYNFFKRQVSGNFLPVGDTYKIGPGDTIAVYFWGDPVDILGLNGFYSITVDRDGKIFVPNLGVFYVWGLDLARVKQIITDSLSKKFKRFSIEITLGQLRQFPVYVSGYVKNPGVVQSLGTYSVIDAIILAGGIMKNGSLRNIEIIRKDEKGPARIKIDLYDFLIKGGALNIPVREGDTILVNNIGSTTAVAGDVKRPGIYEIKQEDRVNDVIELAGRLTFSAYSAGGKHIRYEKDTVKIYEGLLSDTGFLSKPLADGDSITVQSVNPILQNEIIVDGHVKYPGVFSWHDGIKLNEIAGMAGLLPDTDMNIADVRRKDSGEVITFSPQSILDGKGDITLQKKDVVTFYPRWINEPMHISGEIEEAKLVPFYTGIKLLDVMQQVKLKNEASVLKAEIYTAGILKQYQFKQDDKPEDDLNAKRTIYLLDLLVKGREEANISLSPGDRVVIKNVESNERNKTVTLLGEVNHPGIYKYNIGMKLSDIITAAGGYTKNAYPRGMIFTRRNAQKLQMNQINISMISMEEYMTKSAAGLASAGGSDEEKAAIALVMKQQDEMLSIIKKKSTIALGRLALEIPGTLEELKESADNITLSEEDYIYIPARPNYVLLLGNVYNQISVPHSDGKTVEEYLRDVGGPAKSSDTDNMYIIKSNGKIISRESYEMKYGFLLSLFRNFENIELEEGDAVVIPFEITVPVMWRPLLRDITQIIFQSVATLVLASSL